MKTRKMVIKFKDQVFWCVENNYKCWFYEGTGRVYVKISNGMLLQIYCPDLNTASHLRKMIQACWEHGCTEMYLDSGRHNIIITSDDLRNKDSAPKI